MKKKESNNKKIKEIKETKETKKVKKAKKVDKIEDFKIMKSTKVNKEVKTNKKEEISKDKSTLSLSSMILGIIGAIFFWIPYLGFVINLFAIIFSSKSIKKYNSDSFSITGLVLGIIGIIPSILITILIIIGVIY